MEIRMGVAAAVIAVIAAAGCSGGNDSGWRPVIGASERPVIRHLRIEHDDPEAPGLVRAVVEVLVPDGSEVDIRYAWEVAGIARPEDGPEIWLPRARKGTRVALTAIAQGSGAPSEPAVRVVHLQNPQPEHAAYAGQNARPSEASNGESIVGSRRESRRSAASDERAFENGSPPVTGLELEHEGETLHYAVAVPPADGESRIRFRLLLGPEGMWVHPASGEVSWRPESWQTGTHPVEVEVTDASGAVTVEAFSVNAGFDEPELAPPLPAKLTVP